MKMKTIERWFSKRAEKEVEDYNVIRYSERVTAIIFSIVFILIGLYFVAHQILSTGFFTSTFGTFEMIMLYGSLIEWSVVALLEGLGRKNISRDFDAFGGIIFVTLGAVWLLVVFPFEFTYFANALPESLRFMVQWISNDIARGLMVLWLIVNLVAAVYYGILRVFVHKARAHRSAKTGINEDKNTRLK